MTHSKKKAVKEEKKKAIIVSTIFGVVFVGIMILLLAIYAITASELGNYSVSITNVKDEECTYEKDKKVCSGILHLAANITADGIIPNRDDIGVSTAGKGSLSSAANSTQAITISPDKYAELSEKWWYEQPDKKIITITSGKKNETKVEYSLKIIYDLSDEDRNTLKTLENNRQAEERHKEEEKQRQEAEAAAAKAAKEAEEARQKAWAELTYSKYVNIEDGMTVDQLQQIFDFRSKCTHTGDFENYVYYSCNGVGSQYASASFTFDRNTGKLFTKSQYGLR